MNTFTEKFRPLISMPYAQARVYSSPSGAQSLISYRTIVASCTPRGLLYINGLYSATTRRHIGAYMKELGLCYQVAKSLIQYNESHEGFWALDIHTGELVEINVFGERVDGE